MRIDSARQLSGEYETTAGRVRGSVTSLSSLLSEATALLDSSQHPLYGPMPALTTVANDLNTDRRDLDWRVDWIEMSDAQPIGTSGQVQLAMGDTLEGALESKGITGDYADLVKKLLAEGKSLEEAIQAAEFEQSMDELAVRAGEFIQDPNKNPFDYRTVAEIDERIEEILRAFPSSIVDQGPAGLEVEFLHALRLALLADEEGSQFEIRPSDLADRHPHDLTDLAEWWSRIEDERTNGMKLVLTDLIALQTDYTEQQIEDYVTAEHTLSNEDEELVNQLGLIGRWNLSPADVAERNGIIDQLAGSEPAAAQLINELLAAGLPIAVSIRLAKASTNDDNLREHISILREIYGVSDTGQVAHSAEQLGLTEAQYLNGLDDDTIAEHLELTKAFADQERPGAILTDAERDAIAGLRDNYDALAALTGVMVFGTADRDYWVVESSGIYWHHIEALANGDFTQAVIHDGGIYGTSYDTGYTAWEYFELQFPELAATVTPAQVQALAQQLLANPEAWNKVSGAHDGTEILNADNHDFTGTPDGGITTDDFTGFDQQDALRQFLFPHLSAIDTANGGEIDHTLSANDFAQWMLEQPDIPYELRDNINAAIADGLTDKGGWEKIFRAFEVTGYVIAGATLLALPGGNVVLISSLTVAGVAVGIGEAVSANQAGHDEAAAWALAGVALDLVDVAEIASIGFAAAARRALRRKGIYLADGSLNERVFKDLEAFFHKPANINAAHELIDATDAVALARLELDMVSHLTRSGFSVDEATAFVRSLGGGPIIAKPKAQTRFDILLENSRDAFERYPNDIDTLTNAFAGVTDPAAAFAAVDDATLSAIKFQDELANSTNPANVNHLLHGEISNNAVGGHFRHSPNIRIIKESVNPDTGLDIAQIQVFNPRTGRWKTKGSPTTLFPADWTAERVVREMETAYQNSSTLVLGDKSRVWVGYSSSGHKIEGRYIDPSDAALGWATGYPVELPK